MFSIMHLRQHRICASLQHNEVIGQYFKFCPARKANITQRIYFIYGNKFNTFTKIKKILEIQLSFTRMVQRWIKRQITITDRYYPFCTALSAVQHWSKDNKIKRPGVESNASHWRYPTFADEMGLPFDFVLKHSAPGFCEHYKTCKALTIHYLYLIPFMDKGTKWLGDTTTNLTFDNNRDTENQISPTNIRNKTSFTSCQSLFRLICRTLQFQYASGTSNNAMNVWMTKFLGRFAPVYLNDIVISFASTKRI